MFSKISSDIKKATSKKAAKATEEELIEENASYLDAVEEAQNVEEILEDLRNDSLPFDEDDIHPFYVSIFPICTVFNCDQITKSNLCYFRLMTIMCAIWQLLSSRRARKTYPL